MSGHTTCTGCGSTRMADEVEAGVPCDVDGCEILHPDGSDCDYCTYDKPCITIVNTLPRPLKNTVPNHNEREDSEA